MKQNTTLALLFSLLSMAFSFGQAPIAVDDYFEIYFPECQYLPHSVIANDVNINGIEPNTVDLDLNLPGIQSQFTVQGAATFSVSAGRLDVFPQFSQNPDQTISLSYTVQDLEGNTSNPAVITVLLKTVVSYHTATLPSCANNDGTITIYGAGNTNGPSTIRLLNDNVEVATGSPIGPTESYTFYGLAAGNYTYEIVMYCGLPVEQGSVGYLFYYPTLAGTTTATYQDYNNDGIVNVGDIMNYEFSITNDNTTGCIMNDITINNTFITPTSAPIASLSPGAAATLTGYVALTQAHINSGEVEFFPNFTVSNPGAFFLGYNIGFSSTPLNVSSGIKLNAFIDSNSNGTQDNGEVNYTEGTFTYQINSGETHNVITETGTHYLYETNPTLLYNLQYNINPGSTFCGGQYTVATSSYPSVSVASGSGITTYNFAITSVPCNDVTVHLSGGRPRPGFSYTNIIHIKNEGNQTVDNGSIAFTKDAALTLTSVSDPGSVTTADGFTLNFYNLTPGQSRVVYVTMLVPTIPTVSLGQLLSSSVSITPADDNMTNNSAVLSDVIIGSYDPNDKTETHGGKILHSGFTAEDYLTYTIRFENTGTAEAINIRVNDVLDSKLDEISVKMIKASHAYTLDRVGSNLNWHFDGVNLPPSVDGDEIMGHGYIVFKVKPKPGFALGDIIPNIASIYFDFNPAIVTDPCTTEFVPFLGVNAFENGAFEYYPNPTSGNVTFTLKNNAIDTIEVIDILGKTLLSKMVHYEQAAIDLSTFNKGIYFVKLSSKGQEKTIKIVKQ